MGKLLTLLLKREEMRGGEREKGGSSCFAEEEKRKVGAYGACVGDALVGASKSSMPAAPRVHFNVDAAADRATTENPAAAENAAATAAVTKAAAGRWTTAATEDPDAIELLLDASRLSESGDAAVGGEVGWTSWSAGTDEAAARPARRAWLRLRRRWSEFRLRVVRRLSRMFARGRYRAAASAPHLPSH